MRCITNSPCEQSNLINFSSHQNPISVPGTNSMQLCSLSDCGPSSIMLVQIWWLASLAAASYYPRQSPSRTPACFKCNRTVIKSLSSTAPTKYRGYATNQPRRRTNSHTNQPTHRLLLVGVSCIKWRVYTIALFVCSLTVQIKCIASGEDNKLPKEITFALYPPGRSPT